MTRDPEEANDLAQKAISALGDDPAKALADMGVKGVPGDPWNCLLANYLNQSVPLMREDGLGWFVDITTATGPGIRKIEGAAADTFVREFDHGGHPDLVDGRRPQLPPRDDQWAGGFVL